MNRRIDVRRLNVIVYLILLSQKKKLIVDIADWCTVLLWSMMAKQVSGSFFLRGLEYSRLFLLQVGIYWFLGRGAPPSTRAKVQVRRVKIYRRLQAFIGCAHMRWPYSHAISNFKICSVRGIGSVRMLFATAAATIACLRNGAHQARTKCCNDEKQISFIRFEL